MLTGLRAQDATTIQRLIGADQRLLLRIGALLQARLAVTESALGEVASTPALRDLLMDRGLKDADVDSFDALLEARGCADLGLVLTEGAVGDDGQAWRVIALEDELNNPLLAAPAEDARPAAETGVAQILPTLAPQLREPVEGLLAARADDQRAAALEQLRYAAPSLSLVVELMPMVLADGADLVRERAISLIVAAGARPLVVDLIRALQKNDQPTINRLADSLRNLPGEQVDLVIAAILARLGAGHACAAIVHLCTRIATELADHRGLPRLLELLLPHANDLSLLGFIRALQVHNREQVEEALRALLGQGDELDSRLIVLLARADGGAEDLLERGIDLLISPHEAPRERMALAAALRRIEPGPGLAGALARRAREIGQSRDTTVYWLLGELSRSKLIQPEDGDLIFALINEVAKREPGPHIVAILEQQLPSLVAATDAALTMLVEPLAELSLRFRDQRSVDIIRDQLIAMGRASVKPLWVLLDEHPNRKVREMAATVLPELLLESEADELAAAIEQLVTIAHRTNDREEKGRYLLSAARLSQQPQLGQTEPTVKVDEASRGLGDQALAAWGHLAAGPYIDAGRRAEIINLLLVGVTAEIPDLPAEEVVDPNTLDTTYILDARLGSHTYSVPVMLEALARIGLSEHLPPALQRRIVNELTQQWRRVANWEIIWGPGNVQELGNTLSLLARHERFPGSLRLQVAEALLPRITQLSIAKALAEIFLGATDEMPMAELAGRAARRLLQASANGEFADDEYGDLADVIARFLIVRDLGETDAALRRRLAGLLSSHRNALSIRSRENLREVIPNFEADVRERLEWV